MIDVQPPLPDLLTAADVISYLRLDVDERNPGERLRNLIRRQGLPVIKRGRLQLFRRSAIDAWLDGERAAVRTKGLGRLPANKDLGRQIGSRVTGASEPRGSR